jgi:hypothetical protein
MIVSAGVLVEAEHCGRVAKILADHVRATGPDRKLEAVIGELERVVSESGQPAGQSLDSEPLLVSAAEAAAIWCVSVRQARRRAARDPRATKKGGQWLITMERQR